MADLLALSDIEANLNENEEDTLRTRAKRWMREDKMLLSSMPHVRQCNDPRN
jgi:hypothetical protein